VPSSGQAAKYSYTVRQGVPGRHVPPERTDPHPPADAIDQPAFGPFRRTTWLLRLRQQTAPAPPTARHSGRTAPSPLGWPRGLRITGLLGRRTIYRRLHCLSINDTPAPPDNPRSF
jgi:hypothetical protein